MYSEDFNTAQLAAMGLKPSDFPEEDVLVFSDNWDSFRLFEAMSTQWRVGMCGETGLDYNTIPLLASSLLVPQDDFVEVIPNIRVMEAEALRVKAEQRERANKKK